MKNKRKWFSITADDCKWYYYIGSGDGGQKRQKTASACRCVHEPSGAVGLSQDSRKQIENKRTAFKRMTETKEFKSWLLLKIDAGLGKVEIEENSEQGNKIKRKLRLDEV